MLNLKQYETQEELKAYYLSKFENSQTYHPIKGLGLWKPVDNGIIYNIMTAQPSW